MTFSDINAEAYVLGSAFSPQCQPLFEQATDNLFLEASHQTTLATIRELQREQIPIDALTVCQRLDSTGRMEKAGGRAAVIGLTTDQRSPSIVAHQLSVLEEIARRRSTYQLLHHGAKSIEAGDDVATVASETQKQLDGLHGQTVNNLEVRAIAELPETDPPEAELIRHRFLCRGGGALLVGPSGVGKSTLALQCALAWSIGKPVFGMQPAHSIRSLVVQAENDDGDLREMRDGALAGLEISNTMKSEAAARVLVHTCDDKTGMEFLRSRVEPLVRRHRPEMLWIDPVLAFAGCGVSDQEAVSEFLRHGLNPILHKYECACILIHHTNKPASGKEKPNWQAGDFAYMGSGSIEWTNWARAVLAIQSIGSHEVFKLHAAKRGARLRWQDDEGGRSFERHIAHASNTGLQFWRDAEEDEIPSEGGRPEKCSGDEVLQVMGDREWSYTGLCGELSDSIASATVERRLRALKAAGKVQSKDGKWKVI